MWDWYILCVYHTVHRSIKVSISASLQQKAVRTKLGTLQFIKKDDNILSHMDFNRFP